MLEQKDLQAIAELFDARITKTEETLNKKIDALDAKVNALSDRVDALDAKVDALDAKVNALSDRVDALEARITDVETTLIKELMRTEDILTRKIVKIEGDLEELNQYYRIERLESGNVGLTLQILEGYHKRLEALEKKIA